MANYCICRINKIHLSFFEKKVNKLYKKRYFSDLFFQKKRRRGEMGPNDKEYNMCYVCIGMLKGDYFFRGGAVYKIQISIDHHVSRILFHASQNHEFTEKTLA